MKAVIFDLFGTLLWFRRNSNPFRTIAFSHSSRDVRGILEVSMTTSNPTLHEFGSRIGLLVPGEIESLQGELDADILSVELFPDVIPTLNELRKRGIRLGLISNLATPYKQAFESHRLNDYFDSVVFSCDCGFLKPDPRIFHLALRQLEVDASETIMVGDSFKADVDGANKSGMRGIHLVRSGYSSPASSVISTLTELVEH